jgi:hypothetical protein
MPRTIWAPETQLLYQTDVQANIANLDISFHVSFEVGEALRVLGVLNQQLWAVVERAEE